jgi:S-adenosylmethionine:tRNA ribosyltransferase-isomerase
MEMRTRSDNFDFGLNDVRVPKEPRPVSDHRLLVYDAKSDQIAHSSMPHIRDHLDEGDLLVFNNSKVMPVSLYRPDDTFVLIIEPQTEALENVRVICPFKPKVGEVISFPYADIELIEHEPGWDVYRANITTHDGIMTMSELLDRHGQFPLPIYIKRQPTSADTKALQNHFADAEGSIAPPVAGTHFDADLLSSLEASGIETAMITLHVGYGTFRSFKAEYVEDHVMDAEHFVATKETIQKVDAAKKRGSRVVAVGTTSARVLETLGMDWENVVNAGADVNDTTSIFIRPPYTPRIAGGLVTNFQYPKLPVIAMAATFVGLENMRRVYFTAHDLDYAFYSLGDAMLLKF